MTRTAPAGPSARRAPRAVLLALALAVVLLAVPAAAQAASLTIAIASDPVAGLPSGVDYEYDTDGGPLFLTVVARPTGSVGCQSTPGMDATLAGAAATTYLTPDPIAVVGHGGARLPYTFPISGSHRVCAWLHRSSDDVVVAAAATADVRLPKASLSITAQPVRPRPAGADIQVHAVGTVEAAADVLVTAVPSYDSCPLSYDEDAAPRVFLVEPSGTPTRVSGAFDLTFISRTRFPYGTWKVCAYTQDDVLGDDPSTTAEAAIELSLKPSAYRSPRIRRVGHYVTCDGGRWRGAPKPKLAYAWRSGAKKLRATGRRLPVTTATKGKSVRCRVTASNKVGKGTAVSRPLKVR